jgi:macrolide-specific efflux system membrane fusion protein
MNLIKKFPLIFNWIVKSKLRIGVAVLLLVLISYFGYKNFTQKSSQPQYQTAQVEKGTLVNTISSSGNVLSGNSVDITTTASGVITQVFVRNGESVSQGQQIAEIQLDQSSQAKLAQAYSSYLSAKVSLDLAQSKINSLQASEFAANQKFINDAVARGLATNDPTYIQQYATWLQAEADYKNQQGQIAQSQAALNSAAISLSQISSTITAPATGTIANLILTEGMPVVSPSSTTTSSIQKLGTVTMEQGGLQATVNLSEIDAPKVRSGQRVTLTLDALGDKTFTGRVGAINTTGSISSGVTTYPATIIFDTTSPNIYPNMAVTAKIILNSKTDVLLVPSAAIQTSNGQSVVRILKSGKITNQNVEVGLSNDTQSEIISGVYEGDEVVTGVVSSSTTRTQNGTSPFSSFGGGRGLGGAAGGGNVRVGR